MFHLPNEPIDEFQDNFRVLSIVLNYPIYFSTPNLKNDTINFLQFLAYIYTLILLSLIVTCSLLVINKNFKYQIPFQLTQYLFLYTQWIFDLPICIILYQFKYVDNYFKGVVHTILFVFYFVIVFLLYYFNLISSVISQDFFNLKSNNSLILYFCLKLFTFLASCLVCEKGLFLFIGYIIVFIILIKVTYDFFHIFTFYNNNFIIVFSVNIFLLYERLVTSVINKYTINAYDEYYKSYYVTKLSVGVISFIFMKYVFISHIQNYALNFNYTKLKSLRQCWIYFSSWIYIISNSETNNNELKKRGIIFKHYLDCEFEETCPLKRNDWYIPIFNTSLSAVNKKEFYTDDIKAYHMIKELYGFFYKTYRFNKEFCLSYIIFILFHFGNYELGLIEIETTIKFNKISLSDEFILDLLKLHCNERIIRGSEWNKANDNWGIISILKVINYDKLTNEIKNYIYLSLENKKQWWKLYESDDIIIEEMFDVGEKYFKEKKKLKTIWSDLNEICEEQPDSEITRMYCEFWYRICDEKVESTYILEKLKINYPKTGDELFNNKYKSDIGVVVIEGNCAINPGKINYINQSLIKMLGYNNKNEFIGNNIKMIIPGSIGRYHDESISSYFDKGRSDVLKKTLNILCMKSKEKYWIPIHLLISFIPSFGKAMEGIGLIKWRNKTEETFIWNENGNIEAMTLRWSQMLNITPNWLEKNSYYIQTYLPELMKPERDGIPKFMTDEYFNNKKKIEIKIDLTCPKNNWIDTNLFRIKARNVYIQANNYNNHNIGETIMTKSQAPWNDLKNTGYCSDMQSGSSKWLTNTKNYLQIPTPQINMNSTTTLNTFNNNSMMSSSNNLIQTDISKNNANGNTNALSYAADKLMTNANSNTTQIANNFFANCSKTLYNKDMKKTPDMELISKFRAYFYQKIKKTHPKYTLIDDIYNSMLLSHHLHGLTQKAEIILTHIGIKVYQNKIPIHIMWIPSEYWFENKNDDEYFTEESEVNFAEKAKDNLIKINDDSTEDINLYEVGSVNGRNNNVLLHSFWKMLKTEKKTEHNYTHTLIGGLMSLAVIITMACIILLFYYYFNFSEKFFKWINDEFTLNTQVLDISKYATLVSLNQNFQFSSSGKYEVNPYELWLKRGKDWLGWLTIWFKSLTNIFDRDTVKEYMMMFDMDYYFTNKQQNINFIKVIYWIINNSVNMNQNQLNDILANATNLIRLRFSFISAYLQQRFVQLNDSLFFWSWFALFTSVGLMIVFLFILFFNYKNKKNAQIKILSVYEEITNEEVEKVLLLVYKYEKKFLTFFKNVEEYKQRRIKFNSKNTELMQRRNLMIMQEKMKKKQYNILNQHKEDLEIEEKKKKNLILRDNMTMNYIISFLVIFSFVLIYTLFFFVEIIQNYRYINKAERLISMLFISKFLLHYQAYSLDSLWYKDTYIVSNDFSDLDYYPLFNLTLTQFNMFSSQVIQNSNWFMSNISDIMVNNLCDIFDWSLCAYEEFEYMQGKGLRSLVSFYFKTIMEAHWYYSNNYFSVNDVEDIVTNVNFNICQFLIEDIDLIYNEVYLQIQTSLENKVKNMITLLIIIAVIFALFFLCSLFYRWTTFIRKIRQEEVLCNQLITELPYDMIRINGGMQNILTESIALNK